MRILVISAEIPFPPIGGGRLRAYHWLQALSLQHEVTLVAFTFDGDDDVSPPIPLNVIRVPWEAPPLYSAMESKDTATASRAFEILNNEIPDPWYASYFDSEIAADIIRQEVSKGLDLVLFEDSDMARFASLVSEDVPKMIDMHNVYTVIMQRSMVGKSGDELRAAQRETDRTLAFEKSVAQKCDLCLTCSEHEAAAVRDLFGVDHVVVLPNGVDTTFFAPRPIPPDPGTLLFTGSMNYPPNIEAVSYFVTEILPRIHDQRPDAVFQIVGKEPPERVKQLRSSHVIIHGPVPDVRPYFARAEIFVGPILSGGGTRLKILEAAATAKPIITTSLGAEGLEFRPDKDLLIADSPDAFAQAVVRLLDDHERQSDLGRNARRASLAYEWRKLERNFGEFIDKTAMKAAALQK